MAADPFDALRLTLMQDVLPVGLAMVDRVRKGGPKEVLAAFDGRSADPLGSLRQEGEPAARTLRDTLDRLQPGLGNPVLKVEVRDVPPEPAATPSAAASDDGGRGHDPGKDDPEELQAALSRIAGRLERLERLLEVR
ncbi:MAG: hypothetical protein VKO26_02675 [Cyanobacteriota bacterium]|nr:hypothetical protein [Cyanobacteriota bacterium]